MFQFYIKIYLLSFIMECIYYDNQHLNMTMINHNDDEYEIHNSNIYEMLEQIYHFICIWVLLYVYTSIVYEVFKNEQPESFLEVNKNSDLYFETQEIMKENISNLQYKMDKIKKTIQKLKKQTKNKNKKILDKINKLMLLHEDNA